MIKYAPSASMIMIGSLIICIQIILSQSFFFQSNGKSNEPFVLVPLIPTTGVHPTLFDKYKKDTFQCDNGKVIPIDNVNDNYCDCADGTDEPGIFKMKLYFYYKQVLNLIYHHCLIIIILSLNTGTNACLNGKFFCLNQGYVPKTLTSSRVEDGVCDCCDGSDERSGELIQCPNTCAAAAAAEKEKRRGLQQAYQKGAEIRRNYIAGVKKAFEEKTANYDQVLEQVETSTRRVEALEADERAVKEQFQETEVETGEM
jgi:protein kinase C substrate 80K-H